VEGRSEAHDRGEAEEGVMHEFGKAQPARGPSISESFSIGDLCRILPSSRYPKPSVPPDPSHDDPTIQLFPQVTTPSVHSFAAALSSRTAHRRMDYFLKYIHAASASNPIAEIQRDEPPIPVLLAMIDIKAACRLFVEGRLLSWLYYAGTGMESCRPPVGPFLARYLGEKWERLAATDSSSGQPIASHQRLLYHGQQMQRRKFLKFRCGLRSRSRSSNGGGLRG
jgi:hypothetical protein